jgi:hypothetical protein
MNDVGKPRPQESLKIKPDPQDFEEVERQHGRAESDTEQAEHYRLAQANKLIRLNSGRQ